MLGMTKGLVKDREQINDSGILWSQVCVSKGHGLSPYSPGWIWHTNFYVNLLIYQRGKAKFRTQATMMTFSTELTSKECFQPST